jgi:hypothetical protein
MSISLLKVAVVDHRPGLEPTPAVAKRVSGPNAHANRRQRNRPQPAEPPPRRQNSGNQAATFWSPPLTQDGRGRQRAGSGSREAPPQNDLRPARPFQARAGRSPGRLARCLGSRGRSVFVPGPSASTARPSRAHDRRQQAFPKSVVTTPSHRLERSPWRARSIPSGQPSYSANARPKAA